MLTVSVVFTTVALQATHEYLSKRHALERDTSKPIGSGNSNLDCPSVERHLCAVEAVDET